MKDPARIINTAVLASSEVSHAARSFIPLPLGAPEGFVVSRPRTHRLTPRRTFRNILREHSITI
jgi:hypothetical protein